MTSREWQVGNRVAPVRYFGGFGDQFQVANVVPNRAAELMPKRQSCERFASLLPVFRQRFEADVLSEDETLQLVTACEEFVIFQLGRVVFVGGQNIDTAPPKLIRDRPRNMHVHVKRDGHLRQPFGDQSLQER